MNNVLVKHGLSKSIVSDQDPRFTSAFLKELGTELKLSTAHHPQTSGQTERMNRLLESHFACSCRFDRTTGIKSYHYVNLPLATLIIVPMEKLPFFLNN